MDGKQENSSLRKIFILTIVVALAAPVCSSPELSHDRSAEEDCPGDEYWSTAKGHCCNKCHAGYRLERDCESSHLKSICKPCPDDYYIENSNSARNCFRCRTCSSYEQELSPCTSKQNRQCVCTEGFFRHVISNFTWQCLKCTACGEGEQERVPCSGSTNRACECKEKFYRNSNKICEECKTCNGNKKCSHLCGQSPDWQLAFVVMIAFMSLLILISICVLILKRRPCHSKEIVVSTVSSDSEMSKDLLSYVSEDGKTAKDHSAPIPLPEHELSVQKDPSGQEELPDCVPRGFKTCHFIYFLLQHVPASRFKELVRCLGVSERDIEWAERDNHTCKEAQFQMLKVWCDSGRGDGVDTLSRARLLEMTQTLRDMGLTAGAEAIEANFQIL